MKKTEQKNFVTPLFVIFAVVMFTMAFISLRYSVITFIVELILAITATIIVILSILNLKTYISNILSAAVKRMFREESRTIDDIRIPAVILGPYNEIVAANTTFVENVCGGEDPLGDNIKKYLSGENTDAIYEKNGTDTQYGERWYIAFAVKHEYGSIVYFIDDNDYKVNSDEYESSRPVVAIIAFDNKEIGRAHV